MEIKLVSREMIRPSPPTPSHLRKFKLSLLDQHVEPSPVPIVYHYPPQKMDQCAQSLRHSLAKALSIYYPLAGRITEDDHVYIDCNDEGAVFIETRVNSSMSGFLKRPDKIDLSFGFVPSLLECPTVQVGVQVNVFTCGGISIGLCTSHKIIDAATANGFVKCWAAITSGREDEDKSLFFPDLSSSSSLFPPRKELPLGLLIHKSFINEGSSRLRSFIFDGEAIATLKAKVVSEFVPHPSRAQVVGCFIWERIMHASETLTGFKRPYVLAVATDTRRYTSPPLSDYAIGNNFWWTMVPYTPPPVAAEAEENIHYHGCTGGVQDLVRRVKERLIAVTNGDFIQRLQGDGGFDFRSKCIEEAYEYYERVNPQRVMLVILNGFRFTELDFGWGKPIWVCHIREIATTYYANQLILGETSGPCGGDGIEAWLVLGEKEMSVLETDPEFLRLASSNNIIITFP